MASVLVSVPRLASFSFMRRWERWRTQKKEADTASATRMKSMQRTESSRNWPDSTLVSFTTGIWVRLPLWRTHAKRENRRSFSPTDVCFVSVFTTDFTHETVWTFLTHLHRLSHSFHPPTPTHLPALILAL